MFQISLSVIITIIKLIVVIAIKMQIVSETITNYNINDINAKDSY